MKEKTIFMSRGLGDKFDIAKFNPIKNRRGFCKPRGGLWSSPINSNFGWIDWCRVESYREEKYGSSSFKFSLKPEAKIYKINCDLDLFRVPYKVWDNSWYIDYERMAEKYDAIWLTEEGERSTRFSEPMDLYGWDCETLLVLRPECIEVEEM